MYYELNNFTIIVRNIFLMISYNIQENEEVTMIMKWLGLEGLRFVQTLNDREQEKCKTSSGLFEVLSEKLRLQHNETILTLQYCNLVRRRKRKCFGMDGLPKNQMNMNIKKEIESLKNNSLMELMMI